MIPPERAGTGPPGRPTRSFWLVLALGLALHLPSLGLGFYADDYVHQIALHEPGVLPAIERWNLFDFGTYSDWAAVHAKVGTLPWWTSPDWKVRFLRPLASLSLWLDAELFGRAPIGYHLTSLALYALLLVVLRALYLALGLSGRAAVLALLLFALCDATFLPVGWIANRNSLLAALFTVCAVVAVRSFERRGAARALALSLAAATLATLAKESGSVAFALCAFELVRVRARAQDERMRACATRGAALALLLAALHVVWLVTAGYGTRSLFYATPWGQPGRFLASFGRLVVLAPLALAGPLPLDLLVLAGVDVDALALAAVLPSIVLVRWVARRSAFHPAAPTLAAIAVLSLLPEGGAPLSERLVFGAAIGSSGLFALFFERLRQIAARPVERIGAGLLFVSLTLGSGAFLLLQGQSFADMARKFRAAAVEADVGERALGRREVLVLQAPSMLVGFALASTWGAESDDRGLAFWPLQLGRRGLRWTRLDERSFELASTGEPFLRGLLEAVYLAERPELAVGTRWRTPLFEVQASEVEGGELRAIRVTLDRSADDERLRFLVAREGRFVHQPPPAVGETVVIEEAPPLRPFLP